MTGRARGDGLSDRQRYTLAVRAQKRERERSRTPVPGRITAALDLAGLDGPEVDIACDTWEGNPAGDVDAWEDTTDPRLPTDAQVELLAKLTGQPVAFFYLPWVPPPGVVFVCDRSAPRGRRCQAIDTRPDAQVIPLKPAQGVLF